MNNQNKSSLIQPLVEHIITHEKDVNVWRKELVESGAFSTEQVLALGDNILTQCYRTMLAVRFNGMRVERILSEIEVHHVIWSVDMGDEHQNCAVCY